MSSKAKREDAVLMRRSWRYRLGTAAFLFLGNGKACYQNKNIRSIPEAKHQQRDQKHKNTNKEKVQERGREGSAWWESNPSRQTPAFHWLWMFQEVKGSYSEAVTQISPRSRRHANSDFAIARRKKVKTRWCKIRAEQTRARGKTWRKLNYVLCVHGTDGR